MFSVREFAFVVTVHIQKIRLQSLVHVHQRVIAVSGAVDIIKIRMFCAHEAHQGRGNGDAVSVSYTHLDVYKRQVCLLRYFRNSDCFGGL